MFIASVPRFRSFRSHPYPQKGTAALAVHSLMIDTGHSAIEFAATYAMNSIIKGRFLSYSGSITVDTDDPESSTAAIEIETRSLTSDNESRDSHLKSADFFDVETTDLITFESTSVEVIEDGHWHVNGDLTILGHTRAVALDTRFYGIVEDANGDTRAGFVAETDIRRSDWYLTWNAEQESGVLVSDRVRVSLYISAIPADDRLNEQVSDEDEV